MYFQVDPEASNISQLKETENILSLFLPNISLPTDSL